MSTLPLDKDLDPTPVVTALLEKTRAGKVKWEPTAGEHEFIASVGGGTTLKICMKEIATRDEWDNPTTESIPVLSFLSDKGKTLWEVTAYTAGVGLWELFKVAERVGNKLDDMMVAMIQSLQSL